MNAYLTLHLERNARWLFLDVALLGYPGQIALQLADLAILAGIARYRLRQLPLQAYSEC